MLLWVNLRNERNYFKHLQRNMEINNVSAFIKKENKELVRKDS